jgi:hypothetical protein
MTETLFLESSRQKHAALYEELDKGLQAAPEATWQRALSDNGKTTGQIVRHLLVTIQAHEPHLRDVLKRAGPAQGKPVGNGLLARFILIGLAQPSVPAIKQLTVNDAIAGDAALKDWKEVDRLTNELFDLATGKALGEPRYRNPIVPLFRFSAADALSVFVAHLGYHAAQLRRRLT